MVVGEVGAEPEEEGCEAYCEEWVEEGGGVDSFTGGCGEYIYVVYSPRSLVLWRI